MDLHEALVTRRTIHRYASEPLPEGALDRALQAAHHAPCHKHTWPWRFIVLGPQAQRRFIDSAVLVKAPDDAELRERFRAQFMAATGFVGVAQVVDEHPHRAKEDYAAIACAVQNLMLSLHADGVGSKWSTGRIIFSPDVAAVFEIAPPEQLVGFLWMGQAAAVPRISRPSVESIVRRLP